MEEQSCLVQAAMHAPAWQQRLFALGDLTPEERAKASNLILAMPPEDRSLAVPEDAAMATLCVKYLLKRVEAPALSARQQPALADYLQSLAELDRPSDVAKDPHSFMCGQEEGKQPRFHHLRPNTQRCPVPLQLAVPEFQAILAAAYPESEGDEARPGDVELDMDMHFAHHLCMSMSRSFEDEFARVQELHWMLQRYLPELSLTLARRGEAEADVAIEAHGVSRTLLLIVEAKNEAGMSGDALLQGIVHFGRHVAQHSGLLASSFCPALLLELVGPQLRLSGLAFVGQHVVCEPLTPMMSLLDLHDRQPAQTTMLARCLHAMRSVLGSLLQQQGKAAAAPAAPGRAGLWGCSAVPMPHCLQLQVARGDLARVDLLAGPDKMVYLVEAGSSAAGSSPPEATRAVVKYVRQYYGEQVHRAWADVGLAPQLLAIQPAVGPWLEVRMEHLALDEGWVPLTAFLLSEQQRRLLQQRHLQAGPSGVEAFVQALIASLSSEQIKALGDHVLRKLREAHGVPVGAVQREGEVRRDSQAPKRPAQMGAHGDLRPPNVLVQLSLDRAALASGSAAAAAAAGAAAARDLDVTSLPVKFIDFDWAGVEGEARFPAMLNPAVPWPQGVGAGQRIRQQHDELLLSATLAGQQGQRVWPWETQPNMGLGAAFSSGGAAGSSS